jgi:hypothetical protein
MSFRALSEAVVGSLQTGFEPVCNDEISFLIWLRCRG